MPGRRSDAVGKLKSLFLDASDEARTVLESIEADAQSARERELAFREELQRELEQDPEYLAWRAEAPFKIKGEVDSEHLEPCSVPRRDDWEFDPIFDEWPDFDLYDPEDEKTESGLAERFVRMHHYLCDRADVIGVTYTDTPDGLTRSFLMYGERTIHGVRVDENGKMVVDYQEPEAGFLRKWNERNVVDALSAANVRDHVWSLIQIADRMTDSPVMISEFITALAAHTPNRACRPTLCDAAARIALRVVARAEQFDLTIEELLAQSNVSDVLSSLRSASEGDSP